MRICGALLAARVDAMYPQFVVTHLSAIEQGYFWLDNRWTITQNRALCRDPA